MAGYRKFLCLSIAGCMLLSACASDGQISDREQTGAIIGSLLGAALGAAVSKNKAQGAIIGAFAGGALGYGVGRYLDQREQAQLMNASRTAAMGQTGQRYNWQAVQAVQNSDGNADQRMTASGWVVPTSDIYTTENGDRCRNLQQVAQKNGQTYQSSTAACESSGWELPSA